MGLGLGHSMNTSASPNLWDAQTTTKYGLSHKGLDGIRFYKGPGGQNSAMSTDYADASRLAMGNALDMYAAQAQGTAPSLANAQMQQGIEQNNRAAMGLLGQSRGGNIAGSYQQALGAQSGANMQAAQQGAINRMAEQQAGMAGYAGLAQQQSQLGLGYSQLAAQTLLGSDQNDLAWYGAKRGMDLQRQAGDRQFLGGMINAGIGAVGSVAGAMASMSDERAKTGLAPASVADATAEVGGLGYEYKPGLGQPEGQQFGVSAQQLAQTSLGPTLVRQRPDGMLGVDGERAGIAALAGTGENTRRIQELERMLQTGGEGARHGSASDGAMREQEAARLSQDIAAERGRAQVQRGVNEGRGGPAYDFGGRAPMTRGGFDRGNIDLRGQPEVRNPDGSISTVDSASYNLGGRETLLPSVTPDGRHLRTDDEIVREYERTGRHLGRFGSPAAASSYAGELHDAYANGAFRRPYAIDPFGGDPQAPGQREPMMQARAMPRGREDAAAMSGLGGMRGQPVLDGNQARRVAPDLYYEGDARPYTADGRRALGGGEITPEWQAAIDTIRDESDRWLAPDETGRMVYTGKRMDMGGPGRTDQRYIDNLDDLDREALLWQQQQDRQGRQPAGMI